MRRAKTVHKRYRNVQKLTATISKRSQTHRNCAQTLQNLSLKHAQIIDNAGGAFGFAGFAHVAAMQDQPVMGMLLPFRGDDFFQRRFGGVGIAGVTQADAVGDAKYMRIHCDGSLSKRAVQPDVGGFSANAGKAL